MQVIQNEDEVIVIDDNGNKFLRLNPGLQSYEFGDLDDSSNGGKVVVNDRAGTQNIKFFGVGMVLPPLPEGAKSDFIFEPGTVLFNSTTKKFQGFNGTSWVNLG